MNDFLDRHPSCVHSDLHHNVMSMYSAAASCSCEECARYKLPPQPLSEQSSAIDEMQQQQHMNIPISTTTAAGLGRIITETSTTSSPPTTYLARRLSTANSATSPKMPPAGFGLSGGAAYMQPHQRRASFEFHNRERSFQQHSAACDCQGSGVGCGCSFTCNC